MISNTRKYDTSSVVVVFGLQPHWIGKPSGGTVQGVWKPLGGPLVPDISGESRGPRVGRFDGSERVSRGTVDRIAKPSGRVVRRSGNPREERSRRCQECPSGRVAMDPASAHLTSLFCARSAWPGVGGHSPKDRNPAPTGTGPRRIRTMDPASMHHECRFGIRPRRARQLNFVVLGRGYARC